LQEIDLINTCRIKKNKSKEKKKPGQPKKRNRPKAKKEINFIYTYKKGIPKT